MANEEQTLSLTWSEWEKKKKKNSCILWFELCCYSIRLERKSTHSGAKYFCYEILMTGEPLVYSTKQ